MNTVIPASRFNSGDIITILDSGVKEQLLLVNKLYMSPDVEGCNWEVGWHYQYTSINGDSYDAMMEQNYIWENLINPIS